MFSEGHFMRLTTIAASAAALALTAGGAAVAVADPGPNGNNTFGLCTAYFAGSERGQEEKRKAPPFQGLEAAAEEADQTVEEYCAENGQHPGGKE
jgi:hypothetical protein